MNPLTQKAIKIILHSIGMIGFTPGSSILYTYYYTLGCLDMAKKLGVIDPITAEDLERLIYQRRDEMSKFDIE